MSARPRSRPRTLALPDAQSVEDLTALLTSVRRRWQLAYLPVYSVWAALVVVFPPVFGYRRSLHGHCTREYSCLVAMWLSTRKGTCESDLGGSATAALVARV
jgi:hypothetical protein